MQIYNRHWKFSLTAIQSFVPKCGFSKASNDSISLRGFQTTFLEKMHCEEQGTRICRTFLNALFVFLDQVYIVKSDFRDVLVSVISQTIV